MSERIDDAALDRAIYHYEKSTDVFDADVYRALAELRDRRTENARLRSLLHSEGVPAHLPGWAVYDASPPFHGAFYRVDGPPDWAEVLADARGSLHEGVDEDTEYTALFRLVPVAWVKVHHAATATADDIRHPAADLLGVSDE